MLFDKSSNASSHRVNNISSSCKRSITEGGTSDENSMPLISSANKMRSLNSSDMRSISVCDSSKKLACFSLNPFRLSRLTIFSAGILSATFKSFGSSPLTSSANFAWLSVYSPRRVLIFLIHFLKATSSVFSFLNSTAIIYPLSY